MGAVTVALVDERFIRVDFFDDEVVFGTETVVGHDVAGFEVLVFGVDGSCGVEALREEEFPGGWGVPYMENKINMNRTYLECYISI